MTNPLFPNIEIKLNFLVLPKGNNRFHEQDKEGLRNFLRLPSAEEGKLNLEFAFLTISDTLNWYTSEEWVDKLTFRVGWNRDNPKRLTNISFGSDDAYSKYQFGGYVDCSKFTELTSLSLYSSITGINTRENKLLERIDLNYNNISSLDLTQNEKLKYIRISYDDSLTKLDISDFPELDYIESSGNLNLTEVSITNNPLLTEIFCKDNIKLDKANLSNLPQLLHVDVSRNQLTQLNITDTSQLEGLYCNDNKLRFSTLPVFDRTINYQAIHPQAPILGPDANPNDTIDLSKEYNIKGVITNYYWFDENGRVAKINSLGNGRFINYDMYAGQQLRCLMHNAYFKGLNQEYYVKIRPLPSETDLKGHLRLSTNYNHSLDKNQVFDVIVPNNFAYPDQIKLGLFNPANGALRDSLVILSREGDIFKCRLNTQTANGNYMLMPYYYKDGKRFDLERAPQTPWIDKLPVKVSNTIGYFSYSNQLSSDITTTRYMQLNNSGKINELFSINPESSFQVHIPISEDYPVEIGLFYPDGTFYTQVSVASSNHIYRCHLDQEVQDDADYILMPYMVTPSGIQAIERQAGSKFMDRLPLHVNSIWRNGRGNNSEDTKENPDSSKMEESNILIYPNPVKDILYVKGDNIQKIEIYTVSGTCLQEVINSNSISLRDLPHSIYLVKVTTSTGTTTKKVTKE